MRHRFKNSLRLKLVAFTIAAAIAGFGLFAIARSVKPRQMGQPLTELQSQTVHAAINLMRSKGLVKQADLAAQIDKKGIWRAASPDDPYMKQSEADHNTPFAYTLSTSHQPSAIVLAARFFTETTPTARPALMIHEMGHYEAYVKTGHSDEFDGYKAEYDTHRLLGLTEADGLTYFAMLDGVVEYVAPRLPVYKTYADVKEYMAN